MPLGANLRTLVAIIALALLALYGWSLWTPPTVAPTESGGPTGVQPSSEEATDATDKQVSGDGPSRKTVEPESGSAAAPTSTAPVLTFEGVLTSRIQSSGIFDTTRTRARLKFNEFIHNKAINPEGKTLTDEQEAALFGLLSEYEPRLAEAERADQVESQKAFLKAVDRGQFYSQNLDEGLRGADPIAANRHRMKVGRASQKRTLTTLAGKFGKRGRDWTYSQISTAEPDNIPRSTIIYFTRGDAPGVFQARERITAIWKERSERAGQFFSEL